MRERGCFAAGGPNLLVGPANQTTPIAAHGLSQASEAEIKHALGGSRWRVALL
jgi:hypothetical protein